MSEELRTLVREVVNASDPMRLLLQEAPYDEYEYEIANIVEGCLRVGPDLEALTWVVQNAFDRTLTPGEVPPARSKFMASRLCELWPHRSKEKRS